MAAIPTGRQPKQYPCMPLPARHHCTHRGYTVPPTRHLVHQSRASGQLTNDPRKAAHCIGNLGTIWMCSSLPPHGTRPTSIYVYAWLHQPYWRCINLTSVLPSVGGESIVAWNIHFPGGCSGPPWRITVSFNVTKLTVVLQSKKGSARFGQHVPWLREDLGISKVTA